MNTEHPNTYRVCIWPNGNWCHAADREQFEYSRPANDSAHQVVLIVLPRDDPQQLLQDYVDAEVKRLQA